MKSAIEVHEYYSQLFEAYTVLPPADIAKDLSFGCLAELWNRGKYQEYRDSLDRLNSYLDKSKLDPERRKEVAGFLAVHKLLVEKHILFPECRHRLFESDRIDLRERLFELLNGPNFGEGKLWAAGIYLGTVAELEANAQIKPDKDACNRIAVIKKCLATLDEQREARVNDSTDDEGLPFPQRTFYYPGTVSESSTIRTTPRPQLESELRVTVGPVTAAPMGVTVTGPFDALLFNYSLANLTALLKELGLLNPDTEKATPAARPGAWVGVIYALLDAESPRLRGSMAAIRRAFISTFGAVVSERAVQNGLGKRESEAEQVKRNALSILNR
ncbi:hypothetical protein GCM10027346_17560 [Hymenobacter seoulensis]